MSTVTTRLNLVKPTTLEQYALSVMNNNMDLIDAGLVLQSEWKPAWNTLTLTATWVAYAGGGGYFNGIRYRAVGDQLQIQGMVKSGAAGSQIGVLPVGFRPEYTGIFACEANAAGTLAMVIIDNSGVISYRSGPAAPTYLNINAWIPRAP